MRTAIPFVLAIALAACSKTNVVPLSADSIRVAVDAIPACGSTGAQKLAVDTAAVATVRRGFDRFAIVSFSERSDASGVFTSPGFAGIARRHRSAIQVKLFRHGAAGSEQTIDARLHLGPDWAKKVKNGVSC